MRKHTPRQLAMYASLLLALLITCLVYSLMIFSNGRGWPVLLAVLGATWLPAYIIIAFVLERFINKKMKLIYKTIHNLKLTKKDTPKAKMGTDVFGAIQAEVKTWAAERDKEIEALKVQETYRREFLGNVAHELKTPIFNIQGYIHTLLEGGMDDKKVNLKYLKKASASSDRLSAIVKDLDQISHLESGELELFNQKINLSELIRDVFESFEMRAEKANISLAYEKDYSTPIWVIADKRRIRQVLVNLIDNSLKYGKKGGTTTVRTYDMDDHHLVEIADNGPGIAARHLPRLFERFYRVDESRSRDMGGTGLGLSIVKHIVEAHGQTINVRSTVNVGSTFGFTLGKA